MNNGNHHHLINLEQTNDERKAKYWLCRSLGSNASWARAMRDWPIAKLERRFNLTRHKLFRLMPDGRVQLNSAVRA